MSEEPLTKKRKIMSTDSGSSDRKYGKKPKFEEYYEVIVSQQKLFDVLFLIPSRGYSKLESRIIDYFLEAGISDLTSKITGLSDFERVFAKLFFLGTLDITSKREFTDFVEFIRRFDDGSGDDKHMVTQWRGSRNIYSTGIYLDWASIFWISMHPKDSLGCGIHRF